MVKLLYVNYYGIQEVNVCIFYFLKKLLFIVVRQFSVSHENIIMPIGNDSCDEWNIHIIEPMAYIT